MNKRELIDYLDNHDQIDDYTEIKVAVDVDDEMQIVDITNVQYSPAKRGLKKSRVLIHPEEVESLGTQNLEELKEDIYVQTKELMELAEEN